MEIRKMTDEQLVSLFANGENQAFDILLERHKDQVYNYILLTVRNRDLAEDIFQETFMRAIMTIKQQRYTECGRFAAWICRIARNQIIDCYRRERNENIISNEEYEGIDLFNDRRLSDETVEDRLVREQVLNDVNRLVCHLPEEQREVVRMHYYSDLSFKEIAEKTGVSINTALGRMRYAVLNMRRMAREKDISLAF